MVKCRNCGNSFNEQLSGRCSQCGYDLWDIIKVIKTKSRIPDFIESLEKIKELHLKKNEDYATEENPFANFDFTKYVLGHFKSDRDKTFVWPIACKLARLANLLNNDKPPNNESIEDSLIDIAVYVLLWKADIKRSKSKSYIEPGTIKEF